MADGQGISVLQRKAEAGRTSVAASRQVTPGKALSTAVVQSFDRRLDLVASVSACTMRQGTLAELLEMLPEGGLLAVLEGPGEAQGLMVLDAALLSAILEQTLMGRLATQPPGLRRPTRTDAALTADLIDDVLRAFEAPFLGDPGKRWIAGFGYANYLDDPRPLGLMMEDIDYRIFTLTAQLGGGVRDAKLLIALPADASAHRGAAEKAIGAGHSEGSSGRSSDPANADPDGTLPWGAALEARVLPGPTRLTAILHKVPMPISSIEALQPGMEIPVPAAAIDGTLLLGVDGLPVARGRLGQSGGRRAVRLAGRGGDVAGQHPGGPMAKAGGPAMPAPAAALPPGPSIAPVAEPAVLPSLPSEPAGGAPGDLPDLSALPALDAPPDLPDLSDLPDPGDVPGGGLPDLPDLGDLPPLDGLPKL
ncbi:MAG: FliM/FliN family flagellar motor switch protein [Pseudomonadota bacterium]